MIILPILALLASTGSVTDFEIVVSALTVLLPTGLSIYSNVGLGTPDRTSSIVFYSLSMTLNIVLTAMVVGRMLFLRRRAIKLLGTYHARLYSSVASIFLESGMLYTSFGVLYLVSRSAGSGASYVIMMALGQVVVSSVSYTLIQCFPYSLLCSASPQSLFSSTLPVGERGREKCQNSLLPRIVRGTRVARL